jgi:hypothetical protein
LVEDEKTGRGRLGKAERAQQQSAQSKMTPKEASRLRILDPACGSGSFLIGAYQYLLDWHLQSYVENDPQKHATGKNPALYQSHSGDWKLTLGERKRILLDNIYGVDIDPQAVEVTKLSLLLKVLEGESEQTVSGKQKLLHTRVLPDLDRNIKCGNSLIGPDFYAGQQLGFFNDEERLRINVFDWNTEFPDIMKSGGFDAVIGNPPYLNVDDTWGKKDPRLAALKKQYPHIYNDKTDILFYFLGKSVQLSKNQIGFIVSRAFLEAYKADKLRAYLAKTAAILEIIDFRNFYVFPGVGITTCVINLQCNSSSYMTRVYKLLSDKIPATSIYSLLNNPILFEKINITQKLLGPSPWTFASSHTTVVNSKIDSCGKPLSEILFIGQGMQTGLNEIFGKRTYDEIIKWKLIAGQYYKRASNSDIQRYFIRDREEYILYPNAVSDFDCLPMGVKKHLLDNSVLLKARAAYKRGNCEWWQFTWPLHQEYYDRKRILCPYLAVSNRFMLDEKGEFLSLTDTTVLFDNGQPESLLYLLGLLNSKLLSFRFKSIGKLKSGGIYEYFWNSISKIPIRTIDFSNRTDTARHDRMVEMVEQMLALNKQLAVTNTAHEKTALQRQIDATDCQIDQLVYELYGLTEEKIKIVEGTT